MKERPQFYVNALTGCIILRPQMGRTAQNNEETLAQSHREWSVRLSSRLSRTDNLAPRLTKWKISTVRITMGQWGPGSYKTSQCKKLVKITQISKGYNSGRHSVSHVELFFCFFVLRKTPSSSVSKIVFIYPSSQSTVLLANGVKSPHVIMKTTVIKTIFGIFIKDVLHTLV